MSQTDNNNFNLRLPIRLAGLALLLATAGALAGTAFHRDTLHPSDFVCKDGFRFMVETHRDHLRLRTGAGVFSLVEETPARMNANSMTCAAIRTVITCSGPTVCAPICKPMRQMTTTTAQSLHKWRAKP